MTLQLTTAVSIRYLLYACAYSGLIDANEPFIDSALNTSADSSSLTGPAPNSTPELAFEHGKQAGYQLAAERLRAAQQHIQAEHRVWEAKQRELLQKKERDELHLLHNSMQQLEKSQSAVVATTHAHAATASTLCAAQSDALLQCYTRMLQCICQHGWIAH